MPGIRFFVKQPGTFDGSRSHLFPLFRMLVEIENGSGEVFNEMFIGFEQDGVLFRDNLGNATSSSCDDR